MCNETVNVNGKEIEVRAESFSYIGEQFRLVLDNMNIKDISEISGLDKLEKITAIDLSNNELTELSGFQLDNLKNLQQLFLNNNQITELSGLGIK